MSYVETYRQSPAEMLAGEFVIVYATRGAGRVHSSDCQSRRVTRGQHRTEAHRGALRNGATIAPCCKDHEARLINLGGRVGAW